ncbi:MAG: SUMF1/EgtB/PvdO family nonheme iron enzyme [Elusimicrobia bacterium]|nr:SUMF1/EgtB/PvdO family nonheme iron enzyme [Elusimicrobiota bacterium]
MADPSDASRGQERLRLADRAYEAGHWGEAEREYREAARRLPGSVDALCGLGRSLAKLDRLDEALAAFRSALEAEPGHGSSLYHLALCLDRQGKTGPALAAYEEFLSAPSAATSGYAPGARRRAADLKSRPAPPPETLTMAGPAADGQGTLTLGDVAGPPGVRVSGWRVGEVVDELYEVESVLGEGGFGSVHKVRHLGWHIDVAVKSPREDKVSSRKAMERFVHEANTWVGLGLHPHIVTCYFVRLVGGLPRIFIECLEGGSLKEWLEARRIVDARSALDIAIQISRAMERSHGAGLVHRDLKPGNCLMTPGGTLKVTDFGLAKWGDADEVPDDGSEPAAGDKVARAREATMTGRLGTPEYMAPEQWYRAGSAGAAADAWAFGVILFELMCGNRPFAMADGEPPDAFYCRMLESGWAFKFREDAPPGIRAVLDSCLTPEPKKRESRFSVLRERLEAEYAALYKTPYPREPVKETPLLADALSNQGVSLADLGRTDEAAKLFGRALKQDPTHPAGVYNQGVVLLREGKTTAKELRGRLEVCRRSRPKEWVPAFLLGLVRLAEGGQEAALKDLKEAERLSHNPLARKALEKAKSGGATPPLELFVTLPMGAEGARVEEASFQVLLTRARKEADAGEAGQAYKTLMKARSVKGYQRDSQALDLQETLASKGASHGFRGGWQKAFLEGSEGSLSVAVSADGGRAVSGHEDGVVRVWDLKTGKRLHSLQGHAGPASAAAFLPDGMAVVSGSADGSLKVWDLISGHCVKTLVGHAARVSQVLILPDGGHAVSASDDGTLRTWSLESGRNKRTIKAHPGPVAGVSLSLDGGVVASVGPDDERRSCLRRWDPMRGSAVDSRPFMGTLCSVDLVPDGRFALLGTADGGLVHWAAGLPAAAAKVECHGGAIRAVVVSPDGKAAISGGDDKALKFWDFSGPEGVSEQWVFDGHQEPVLAACFTRGARFALSAGKDGLREWELDWEHRFPERADWDDAAKPFVHVFLLRQGRSPSRTVELPEAELKDLMDELGRRGFGWLRAEGVSAMLAGRPLPSQKVERGFRPTPIADSQSALPGFFKYFFITLGVLGVSAALWVLRSFQHRMPEELGSSLEAKRSANSDFLPAKKGEAAAPLPAAAPADSLSFFERAKTALPDLPEVQRARIAYHEAPAGMVKVPAGAFLMGSPWREGAEDEHPQRSVYLDAFYIDKYEVTNAQYRRCVEAGACRQLALKDCRVHNGSNWVKGEPLLDIFLADDHPVVCASWSDADAYCAWAGRHGKRLPTEAEWEKAAGGYDGRAFPWGDDPPAGAGFWRMNWGEGSDQNRWAEDGNLFTAPVGAYPKGVSPYGVFDMAGNAAEWVADRYDGSYYARSPRRDPRGPASGEYRICRGGAWVLNAPLCRARARLSVALGVPMDYTGFRCAASAAPGGL